MPDLPENNTLVDRLHYYRQEISSLIQPIKAEVSLHPKKGEDEIVLAFRSLQMAKMWIGQALGVNDIDPPWAKDGQN